MPPVSETATPTPTPTALEEVSGPSGLPNTGGDATGRGSDSATLLLALLAAAVVAGLAGASLRLSARRRRR